MQMYPQKIEIKDIILLTETNEITLTGRISRNTLQYDTQISIDTTQLNLIINQLQGMNPDQEVSALFVCNRAANGKSLFYFDGQVLAHNSMEVATFSRNRDLLQIRA
jgi:hypothetical protein